MVVEDSEECDDGGKGLVRDMVPYRRKSRFVLLVWFLLAMTLDSSCTTALHTAATQRHIDVVNLLLETDSNLAKIAKNNGKTVDTEGNVRVWEAMVEGHDEVVEVLLEKGGTLNAEDVGHFACTAAEQGNLKLLKEIVQHGGDVTRPRAMGTSAFHVAVCEENIEMVKYMQEQGADVNKQDMHGWIAKSLAEQQGHEDIKAFFRERVHERAHIESSSFGANT